MDSVVIEIKNRLSVESVLGGYLQMKRSGANFKATCPFHNEKTPSLMISPDKGIWHCFGCDAGGDIFGFVMRMEGVEFPEALKILADKAGIKLRREDPRIQSRKNKMLDLSTAAAQFFTKQLATPAGKIARDYITTRQLTQETVDQFGIGYAPAEWDALLKYLNTKGFKEEDMQAAGLVIRRTAPKSGYFDRFRNRLMFPLRNLNGYIVGFTARVLDPNDKSAKYINTPETDVYHKSEMLFGLDLAKTEIRRVKYAILVEGQMDCISSHQAGVSNVIATSGTALTARQLEILKRYCSNLVLAFDMDKAGQEAIKRGIDLAMEQGFNLRVVAAATTKDPDELIKQDPALWRQAIKDSVSIYQFYFDSALKNLDLTKPEHKKKAAQELLPRIAKIQDVVEQTHYLQLLAGKVGTSEEVLRGALERAKSKSKPERSRQTAPAQKKVRTADVLREERLFGLIMTFPRYIDQVLDFLTLEHFVGVVPQTLYTMLENQYNNEDEFTPAHFISYLEENASEAASSLKQWMLRVEQEREEVDENTLEKEIAFQIFKLRENFLKQRLDAIQVALAAAEQKKDPKSLESLVLDFNHYMKELGALEQAQESHG